MASSLQSAVHQALQSAKPTASIYVAYSGGLDSQVLLSLAAIYAKQTGISLTALHVNHGLSANADLWQSFCAEQCESLAVPLQIKQLNLDAAQGDLEQSARRARYDWFESFMRADEVLFTAHHLNDQAETVLLRLLRGSASRGLSSIPPVRRLGGGTLIRPLLAYPKQILQSYAEAMGLRWMEDESNDCLDFDRNYIRHQVLPTFSSRWSHAAEQLAQSARHCGDDQQLIDALARLDINALQVEDDLSVLDIIAPLKLQDFNALSRLRRRNVLQTLLRPYLEHPLGRRRMSDCLNQLEHVRVDNQNLFLLNKISIAIFNDKIYFLRPIQQAKANKIDWLIDQPFELDSLACVLRLKKADACPPLDNKSMKGRSITIQKGDYLSVHWRQGGERVNLPGESFSRALKKVFQAARIAPWLRNTLPLVSLGDQLVWSAALGHFSPGLIDSEGAVLKIELLKK